MFKKENIKTITVRMAVATVESVFFIPHFARMDVRPANKADRNDSIISSPPKGKGASLTIRYFKQNHQN